jgi:hypothetical protein
MYLMSKRFQMSEDDICVIYTDNIDSYDIHIIYYFTKNQQKTQLR